MAGTYQIRCFNKSDRYNPWERITHVGGFSNQGNWRISQQRCIAGIESGTEKYYVSVNGESVRVVVAVSQYGNKYIKTENDGDQPNNLLSLPECPKT